MGELFQRKVRLEVGEPGSLGQAWDSLRVGFTVERTDEPQPDKATIQVYNLSKTSRSLVEKEGVLVRLFAGYASDEPIPRIFQGEIRRNGVRHTHEGTDWITEMEVEDGGVLYRTAKLSRTYSGPVSARFLLTSLAAEMGAGMAQFPSDFQDVTYQGGYTVFGPIRDALGDLCESCGCRWMIQDGELVISGLGKGTAEEAYEIGAGSGMIGKPERDEEGKVTVVTLLNGHIRPRRKIVLKSEEINGVHIVKKVTHSGDAGWDTAFYSEIEAIEAT